MSPPISIIIPALNESFSITSILSAITTDALQNEIIVVDGGSTDDTRRIVEDCGAQVISSQPGRAVQMNAGAAVAQGKILFFLHADSIPSRGFSGVIQETLSTSGCVAGAFRLAIDVQGWQYRVLENLVWWRSSLFRLPYGDQGLFLTRDTFKFLGGFPDLPIMEDFEYAQKLRRHGRIEILPQKVTTSARRWLRLGVAKTTLINQCIIAGYLLGVSPETLARWYRGSSAK